MGPTWGGSCPPGWAAPTTVLLFWPLPCAKNHGFWIFLCGDWALPLGGGVLPCGHRCLNSVHVQDVWLPVSLTVCLRILDRKHLCLDSDHVQGIWLPTTLKLCLMILDRDFSGLEFSGCLAPCSLAYYWGGWAPFGGGVLPSVVSRFYGDFSGLTSSICLAPWFLDCFVPMFGLQPCSRDLAPHQSQVVPRNLGRSIFYFGVSIMPNTLHFDLSRSWSSLLTRVYGECFWPLEQLASTFGLTEIFCFPLACKTPSGTLRAVCPLSLCTIGASHISPYLGLGPHEWLSASESFSYLFLLLVHMAMMHWWDSSLKVSPMICAELSSHYAWCRCY